MKEVWVRGPLEAYCRLCYTKHAWQEEQSTQDTIMTQVELTRVYPYPSLDNATLKIKGSPSLAARAYLQLSAVQPSVVV